MLVHLDTEQARDQLVEGEPELAVAGLWVTKALDDSWSKGIAIEYGRKERKMTEDDLRRLEEQYLAERAEGETPYHWVQRAYPAWRPMVHFGVSVVIRQQIDR